MKHNDEAMGAGTSANKQGLIKNRLYKFTGLKESDPEYKNSNGHAHGTIRRP
jgi:hypothetical protein